MLPVHPFQVIRPGHVGGRDEFLHEPVRFPAAVESEEGRSITADLARQIGQQGWRQPFPILQVGAVLADDGRQGAQVPIAGLTGVLMAAPLTPL